MRHRLEVSHIILVIHIRRRKHRRIRRLLQARVTGKAISKVHREPCAAEKDRDQYCKKYHVRSALILDAGKQSIQKSHSITSCELGVRSEEWRKGRTIHIAPQYLSFYKTVYS